MAARAVSNLLSFEIEKFFFRCITQLVNSLRFIQLKDNFIPPENFSMRGQITA
jgi:hypothetical protein